MESTLISGSRTLRQKIQNWQSNPTDVWGIPTGFPKLDRMVGGLQPGTMNILGGRTHHGKTAMLNQITFNIIFDFFMAGRGQKGALFSPEVQADDVLLRQAATMTGISSNEVKSGRVGRDDLAALYDNLDLVEEAASESLFMSTGKPVDLSTIVDYLDTAAFRSQLPEFVAIDYLTYIRVPSVNNKTERAALISKTLSELAVEYQIPILVGAQLNRAFEQRKFNKGKDADPEDEWPVLSDISDSSQIEMDCSLGLLLYNPPDDIKKENGEPQSALLLVRKNRTTGRTGSVPLVFDNRLGIFADPDDYRQRSH